MIAAICWQPRARSAWRWAAIIRRRMPQAASTSTWSGLVNRSMSRSRCRSVSRLSPVCRVRLARVGGQAAVSVEVLLDPAPAPVQGIAGEADDVERVIPSSG